MDKYCWIHGACNYNSKDCLKNENRHKNNDTFEKISDSTSYCPGNWYGGSEVLNNIKYTKDLCYSKIPADNPLKIKK